MPESRRSFIAVAVDEQGQVWSGHFGMAPMYFIYDQQGNLRERRSNPYGACRGEKHQHHDDPRLIVNLLPECGVFIGRRMGEASRRKLAQNLGVEPVLTQEQDPTEAVRIWLNAKESDHAAPS